MNRLILSVALFASMLPAATINFDLLPSGGAISGTAGFKIGWGYTTTNDSPDQWLVFVDLNSDPFLFATPNVLFDFPIVAPGATVSGVYNSALGTGLFEITLDSFLAGQVINSGTFVLDAQWWNGDPLSGGEYLADADPVVRTYEATASPVPEPSTALVLAGALLSGGLWRRKRPGSSQS